VPAYPVPRCMIATAFAYLYLLRVQVAIGGALLVLPPLALGPWPTPRSLLENLFIADPPGVFLTTLAAVLVAWSVLLTGRLVLLNGQDRFGIEQWWTENTLSGKTVLFTAGLAAPVILGQFVAWQRLHRSTEPAPTVLLLFAIGTGLLAAYVVAYLALLGAVLLSPAGTMGAARTFPCPQLLRTFLDAANRQRGLPQPLATAVRWVTNRLPADLRDGYIDQRKALNGLLNPGYGLPWSGHWLAFTFSVATFIVYYTIGSYRTTHLNDPTWIPALTFAMLLLLNVNWIAAFLTFFFDRFRIPFIVPAAILAMFSTYQPASDHLFQTVKSGAITAISPSRALGVRASRPGAPIVIVATAGGGIQAAAWTAKVLTGLQQESLEWPAAITPVSDPVGQDHRFSSTIALLSAVSGGAVGSMFFLNEYTQAPNGPGFSRDADKSLSTIVKYAEAPSLDDVGWSLVYNDVPRIFSPRRGADPLLDRGRVLELSWRRQANLNANLSDWRAGVREGWRPAVIFNATLAESGEPLLFSTTDLSEQSGTDPDALQRLPIRKNFAHLYGGLDVPVVTAVRLASSFPYVSPAARANDSPLANHLIDGGYYDNYGIASAIDWLDEAIRERPQDANSPVLFITIKSFPDDPMTAAKARGWFFQAYAPMLGLLNVRTTTQVVRDRFELLLLRDRLGAGADGLPRLRFATFQFPEDGAPLSWKMNGRQVDAIEDKWKSIVRSEKSDSADGDDLLQVKCAFVGASVNSRCNDVAHKAPW